MKHLLVFTPNPTDATSFYRAHGPLQDLKRSMGDLVLTQATEVNWATLKAVDAVFLQRPFLPSHAGIVDIAHASGKKVWVDFDDNLFEVPRSNRTHRNYGRPETKANILKILMKADLVTVSTPALKVYLQGFQVDAETRLNTVNPNIHVVPNAYDEKLFAHYRKDVGRDRKKLICWRGSDTHQKDLMAFTEDMAEAAQRHPDWTWNFVGDSFWYTIERMNAVPGLNKNSIIETEAIDPIEFFKFLYLTQPAVQAVPLWECVFNHSKSNIAWIEAAHAGAVCIGPRWEEWQKPGVLNYSSPKEFGELLRACMRGEVDFRRHHKESWEYIMETLTLAAVNKTREGLLRELLG